MLVGAAPFVTFIPNGFFDRYPVLPVQIFSYFSRAQEEFIVLAAGIIIVMLEGSSMTETPRVARLLQIFTQTLDISV